MKIEIIDKYLAGKMTADGRRTFEQEMEQDSKLKEDVRITAYIIHGIKKVGLEDDNQRLQRLITSSKTDYRRYVATIAAIFIMGLAFADIISYPLYKYVLKPIVEIIYNDDSHEIESHTQIAPDTIFIDKDDKTPNTDKQSTKEDETKESVRKKQDENELVSQVEEMEEEISQEEPQEEEQEHRHVQTMGKVEAVAFGENGTRYEIEGARMNGNTLVVTVVMSNKEDDDRISLVDVLSTDSNGNMLSGYAFAPFTLREGVVVRKQLLLYNISRQPKYLQILTIKEKEGKTLRFKNIPVS